MDKAHIETEKRLARVESHLADVYDRAQVEIQKKADAYFEQFVSADEKKRLLVEKGKLDADTYERWRKNKIMYGRRFTALKEQLAAEYANVNKTALSYINGELPEVYALNYNSLAPDVDGVGGYSFTLTDANTIKYLATTDDSLLPYKQLDVAKDIAWSTKKINSEVLQGILQGEKITDIAKRLENVTTMEKAAAVRNARTMVTGAQNKGRLDSYARAEADGIILQKEWLATNDNRTRHWHAALDGQQRDQDKPFDSEYGKIMYPGDPSAHPANVYNCRCTLVANVKGFRKVNSSANTLTSMVGNSIINTGARIKNIYSKEAATHAEKYYEEIRHFSTDVQNIADNTGKTQEQITAIKNYLFVDNSLYDEDLKEWRRFDPDFAIAQSWQRLIDGKNIQQHDLTLIEHELFEMELVNNNSALSQDKAHKIASQKYNYSKEVDEYYGNLEKD